MIRESTISGNIGIRGGGINNRGRLNIKNSTISGNTASRGGGIENHGTLNIAYSTITNNEAGRVTGDPREGWVGGGIRNFGETGGQVLIGDTILAGNRDGRTPDPSDPLFAPDCFSSSPDASSRFLSAGGNLVGILNANCNLAQIHDVGFDTPFDRVGTPKAPLDPRLKFLFPKGGPTSTHALLPDSPAIDHGPGGNPCACRVPCGECLFQCPKIDQRGAPRSPARGTGMVCDVGAVEFASPWR